MLYCEKCKRLFTDASVTCSVCKGKRMRMPVSDDPVFAVSAYGIERDRIKAALSDFKIHFTEKPVKKEQSAKSVTGIDFSDYGIYVQYSDYEKSVDLLIGIGAIKLPGVNTEEINGDDIILNEDEEKPFNETQEEPSGEQFEEMPQGRRMTVRIISAALLIIILSAIILGVDYVLALIKALFI